VGANASESLLFTGRFAMTDYENDNLPRPSRPLRPPAPGMKPAEIVPAQAPKPSLDRTTPSPPPARSVPEVRQRPVAPAPIEPSTKPPPTYSAPDFVTADDDIASSGRAGAYDEVDEDDLVAVPAPSAEMLLSSGLRHAAAPRGSKRRRSMTLQRTLIPILLTLAVILPASAFWLVLHPEESELRLYGQRLFFYLLGGGAVFLILAIVNMIQVRHPPR